MTEPRHRDAVLLYAATMAAASLMLALLWFYIGRHPDWFAIDDWRDHYRHERLRQAARR